MARKPGFKHSEETKARIGASNSKPQTEAHRQNVSHALTGRRLTETHKAALVQAWSRRKGFLASGLQK